MTLKVAILGRPNVGKSTLFNRLTGTRRALVHDRPGVTRDRIEGQARLDDLRFEIVDTAGLEVGLGGPLSERLVAISMRALEQADLGLLLIDARAGVTALDADIAELLRQQPKPVILLANKCEGRQALAEAQDAWRLGLGEPIAISAEHAEGLDRLADAIRPHLPAPEAGEAAGADADDHTIRLAIVGRPNAGKSSLVNRLTGEDRLLTGPEPGLTRDSIEVAWRWRDHTIRLVDTAGLRRKARIDDQVEQITASIAVRAIREADVVLLLTDATEALEKQDHTIANLALDQGKALVVGVNKWDLVDTPEETRQEIAFRLKHRLSQVPDIPCLMFSSKTGRGLNRLMPVITETFGRWSTRISTAKLNRWLEQAIADNPPPMAQNRRIKFRYATQVASRPPTIALFANKPAKAVPASYTRYLMKSFTAAFDLKGVTVRMAVRHGENPYRD